MLKLLILFLTSIFWIPIVLFLVIAMLAICICLFGTLFIVFGTILLLLFRTFIRIQSGFYKTRRELLEGVDSELKGIPWWRLLRFKWKRHKKKIK